ncbi:hypothetical protein WJX81_000864 [Elliptochloris bilobata]|uniref:TRUD domain-containing protein n=1 Tax=Elliptochloris bilobata TaxID=381761 RepID=A0AAW1SHD8_9CHLO
MEPPTEEDVGIAQFASAAPGFDGILKQRYSDFIVNEISLSGQVQAELNVSSFDKMQRTAVHQFLRRPSLPQLESNTVAHEDGSTVITLFHRPPKQRSNKKRKQPESGAPAAPWPGSGHADTRAPWAHGSALRYCRFVMLKENLDTPAALAILQRTLRCGKGTLAVAGNKDKRGITCQHVTACRVEAERLAAANVHLRNLQLGDFEYVPDAMRLGMLRGNRFEITLRALSGASPGAVAEAAETLRARGFINYFGLQRFGSGCSSTHRTGALLLRGEWREAVRAIMAGRASERPEAAEARRAYLDRGDVHAALAGLHRGAVAERAILESLRKGGKAGAKNFLGALLAVPRNSRIMFVHAVQSYLWNCAASHRAREYGLDGAVAGDLVLEGGDDPAGAGDVLDEDASACGDETEPMEADSLPQALRQALKAHVVTAVEAAARRYSIVRVVLPLPGADVVYPEHATAQVYVQAAAHLGVDMEAAPHAQRDFSLAGAPGGYRRLLHRPADLAFRLLQYSDPDQCLAATDLDKLRGTAPPPVSVLGPGEQPMKSALLALQLVFSLPPSTYATMLGMAELPV